MYFRILSHAGLMVEQSDAQLVVDPWLIGSCYWRSWWNFPEPRPEVIADLKPNFIYLTHLHWDHFQAASLKLFDRATTILVPKTIATRFRKDLRTVGFRNVVELEHGKEFVIAPDFRVTSYQFGLGVDSALAVQAGGEKLLNLNDCKLFGSPLRRIVDRHGGFDFVLRSHSNASGYPYCIDNYEKFVGRQVTSEDYAREFSLSCLATGAKYAVPFASNHCFLHRETVSFNQFTTNPLDLMPTFRAEAKKAGSGAECMVMPPGSSWSAAQGFKIEPFDYNKKDEVISRMAEKYKRKLEAEYAFEDKVVVKFRPFEKYFTRFMNALPSFSRRSFADKFTFVITDPVGTHEWTLDLRAKQIVTEKLTPQQRSSHILIRCHPRVLNDCTGKRMFSVWTASKRCGFVVHSAKQAAALQRLFLLFDAFELDQLPLKNHLKREPLLNYARRWRELLGYAELVGAVKLARLAPSVRDYYQRDLAAMAKLRAARGAN